MKISRILLLVALVGFVAVQVHAAGFEMALTGPPVGRVMASAGAPELTVPMVDDQCDPDGAKFCCFFDATPCVDNPGNYAGGDVLTLNTYWNNVVDTVSCSDWNVNWSLGIKPPMGSLLLLFNMEPVSFGNICDLHDLDVTFCVAAQVGLPPTVPNDTYSWGFGASSPTRPFQIGTIGNFVVDGNTCVP